MTIQQRKQTALKPSKQKRFQNRQTNRGFVSTPTYRNLDPNKSLDWGQVGTDIWNALTKPGEQFKFPIEPIELDFSKKTTSTIYIVGGLIAMSIIGASVLKK